MEAVVGGVLHNIGSISECNLVIPHIKKTVEHCRFYDLGQKGGLMW